MCWKFSFLKFFDSILILIPNFLFQVWIRLHGLFKEGRCPVGRNSRCQPAVNRKLNRLNARCIPAALGWDFCRQLVLICRTHFKISNSSNSISNTFGRSMQSDATQTSFEYERMIYCISGLVQHSHCILLLINSPCQLLRVSGLT